jgi:hypothetical protein
MSDNKTVISKVNSMKKTLKGEAIQTSEKHIGPPLSYVSEKLCYSIMDQHSLIKDIDALVPEEFSSDKLVSPPESLNVKNDYFLGQAKSVFLNQIKTFLALHNRLGLFNDDLIAKLLEDSSSNLESWLNRMELLNSV